MPPGMILEDLYRDICICSTASQQNEVYNTACLYTFPSTRKRGNVVSKPPVLFYVQHPAEAVTDTILAPYLRLLFK